MLSHSLLVRSIFVVALLFISVAIVFTAWISDDALITLACVENFVAHGDIGIYPGERLQPFSHPLWFALLAGLRLLGIPGLTAALGLGFLCTALWLWGLLGIGISTAQSALPPPHGRRILLPLKPHRPAIPAPNGLRQRIHPSAAVSTPSADTRPRPPLRGSSSSSRVSR